MTSRSVTLPALPERYRPLRRLGAGGCAEVFLVEDLLERAVPKAMKILFSKVPARVVSGFRGEFRLLASLEHPGLARVFEFGELPPVERERGRAYYTAEYVEARELGAGGGVAGRPVRDICLATAAVCRTLAYVHARGYVHNDVKPSNVLVGDSPEGARLLDFGLAGMDRARSRTVAGTPGYIAPERLAGREWDGRADLYSVGAMLYRVLGGRRVVQADDPEEALAALRAGWTPLAKLKADAPAALCALCERLLALDPGARPKHAAEVVALLGESVGETFPLETPGTARCYALASVFVGRDAELGALAQALAGVARGSGARILAVGGGAGMGKSRLCRELCIAAETGGWRLASAVCLDRDTPAGPVRRLGTQVGARLPASNETGDAMAGALAAAVKHPTLFFLDDAHRGSDTVWHAAFALARSTRVRAPVAVLVAFDAAQLPPVARQWLAAAAASDEIHRQDLGPLPREALAGMLVRLFGEGAIPRPMQEEIARRSGGAPLLLEEIVRDLVESGGIRSTTQGWVEGEALGDAHVSPRLDAFLRRRCVGLPAPAASALCALAALGGRAAPEAVDALCEAVTGANADGRLGLALLADRSLVLRADGRVEVAHEALCAAVFETMSEEARRDWHRAAVTWLSAHGADHAELARACREAGHLLAAFDHALAAGRRARIAGEGRLAVRWVEEAAAVAGAAGVAGAQLVDLLFLTGEAYEAVGRFTDALGALKRAFDLMSAATGAADARGRVRVAALAARMACLSADYAATDRWLEQASSTARPDDVLAAVWIDRVAGVAAYFRQRIRLARERLGAALAGLDRIPDEPEAPMLRASVLLVLVAAEGRFDLDAAHRLARATVEAAEAGYRLLAARALNNLGDVELERGDPAAAAAAFQRAIAAAEQTGAIAQLPIMLSNLAQAEHQLGAWDRARALSHRAVASAESESLRAVVRTTGALMAWHGGDFEAASREAERALADEAVWQDSPLLLAVAAAAAVERGAADVAEEMSAKAEAVAAGADSPLDAAQASLARAYAVAARDPGRGGHLVEQAAEAFAALGHRGGDLAAIWRDAGRFLARAGSLPAARAAFARSRELLERAGCAPGLTRLDEIERQATAGGPPPDAAVGKPAPSREPLERLLRAAGPGDGSLQLSAEIDGAQRLLPSVSVRAGESAVTLDGELLRELVRAAGESRQQPSGSAERTSLATLAATPVALSGEPRSRLLELSVGAIELRHKFAGVVGRSPEMMRVLAVLERLAESDVPVLLLGETGTGKEILARELGAIGRRAGGPFVGFNCATLPPSLFDAELLGYRRGAFTGAVQDHAGLVEQAAGGILFLDEVSDLPPPLQPKLLRVLEERRVRPLGAKHDFEVDFRLLAATSRDLAAEVAAGRFRSDLYYRLNVVELRLPPLRDRLADLPELCRHLLARQGRADQAISKGAMERLLDYHWPGNIRELENELARASVLAGSSPIRYRHLGPRLTRAVTRSVMLSARGTLAARVVKFEREVVLEALAEVGWHRRRAARALGLTREGLRLLMQRLAIVPPNMRRRQRHGLT